MEYHIKNEDGDIIASFTKAFNRDLCLDTFIDIFPDCEFSIEGEDEE